MLFVGKFSSFSVSYFSFFGVKGNAIFEIIDDKNILTLTYTGSYLSGQTIVINMIKSYKSSITNNCVYNGVINNQNIIVTILDDINNIPIKNKLEAIYETFSPNDKGGFIFERYN